MLSLQYRWSCQKQKDKINYLRSILSDELSIKVLDAAIHSRKTRNYKRLKNLYDNNFEECTTYLSGETISYDSIQYFAKDIIKLSPDEVFIDGGGNVGDTTLNFIKQTQGVFKKVHIFEPVRDTYEKVLQNMNMANNHKDKVIIHNTGLFSSEKEIFFNQNESGSRADRRGKILAKLVALDRYLSDDELEEITYIKLDIEGVELEALKGMRETIIKYKPKLAICIYHKPKDLWEIPLFIKNINPSYKLYIRQHYYKNETVCYAI